MVRKKKEDEIDSCLLGALRSGSLGYDATGLNGPMQSLARETALCIGSHSLSAAASNPDDSPKSTGEVSTTSGRPTSMRFGVLAFSISMAVLLYIDRNAIAVAKLPMSEELGLSEIELGKVMSVFYLVYALAQVPAGWLGDRLGGRAALTLYVIVWSLAMAAMGLANGLTALIAARVMLGLGQAGAYATTASFLKNWIPFSWRGVANSAVSMGGRGGAVIAPALTPWLMGAAGTLFGYATGQWRVVFLFYAAVGLAWGGVFWFWFRNTPREKSGCNTAERELIEKAAPSAATSRAAGLPWREMLLSRNMWLLGLVNFCSNVGWVFLATYLPTYLAKVHDLSLESAGGLAALPPLAGMAGCLSGGFATDLLVRKHGLVWGRRIPGMLSGFGAAVAIGCCMGIDQVLLIILMLSCVYFLADLFLGTTWSTYQDIGGAYVGSILGFANMCGNLGAALSTRIIGSLAEESQWTSVFAMSCGSFLVATICWFWIDPRVPIVKEVASSE